MNDGEREETGIMANRPLFGANVDPTTSELAETFRRAVLADSGGFDLVTVQDHPYNRRFVDTWTLLTALAMRTERVHLGTNVANLPLRPPAMLAKAAATLDVLSNGRVQIGLGAGAFWQAIAAYGVPQRSPAEAYTAFEDALHILRGMWDGAGHSFTYEGKVYQVRGAQPGPAPAHRIPIWVGASGPKMLRLTGRMADGVLVSSTYESPARLLQINAQIDEGAGEAGRETSAIRRGYNVMGIVDYGQVGGKPAGLGDGVLYGRPQDWAAMLTELYTEYGQDTFIYWPVGGAGYKQLQAFAREVIPAVNAAVANAEK
jgi:alkanesulfonate monooxygenase SsuD/methylene tetrahydromethanopterin reductase-like flavin-dependent oxidoreductase (luciferase family)